MAISSVQNKIFEYRNKNVEKMGWSVKAFLKRTFDQTLTFEMTVGLVLKVCIGGHQRREVGKEFLGVENKE